MANEQEDMTNKKADMKNQRADMTKEQRREIVINALKQCAGKKGTVKDIVKYISKHTNFVEPTNRQLRGSIGSMCRNNMGLKKITRKEGEEPQ